jgi:hypothetical protein
LDDDDDDGIEFVMCGLDVPNNDACTEFEELTLDGVVITDAHADVIVNEKIEYKKYFKSDLCEAVLAGMEFTDSVCVCYAILTYGLGTRQQVCIPLPV